MWLASFEGIPTDQIGQFGGYGIVGAVAIILGWRVWQLEKEKTATAKAHDAERDATTKSRMDDWREIATLVREHNVVQANWTTANEARTVAVAAMAEATKLQAAGLRDQTAALDRLVGTVTEASKSNRDLREALVKHGVRP